MKKQTIIILVIAGAVLAVLGVIAVAGAGLLLLVFWRSAAAPSEAPPGPPTAVTQKELMARLAAVPQQNADRAEKVLQLFKQAGLRNVTRQAVPTQPPGCNILATLPGRIQNVIIVGAHFDHTSTGTSIIDNWTGVACMVSLAQALAKTSLRHTFVFVAFDSEERGQAGSRWYVSQLSAQQKARTTAMVNLECLGISTAKVWLTGSADALEQLAAEVAKKENTPVEFRPLHGVSADADSFMAAGIAATTFDSLDLTDFDRIDSPKERVEAVRPDRLEQHYRFILKYLQALDEQTGPISPANKDRPAPKP
jgi:hypothetical protein